MPTREITVVTKQNTDLTSVNVNALTGVQIGDDLVFTVSWDGTSGTVTWPTGFTEKYTATGAVTYANAHKVAVQADVDKSTGADPTPYVISWVNAQHVIVGFTRISNSDNTMELGTEQTGGGETATALSMTVGSDRLVLAHAGANRFRTATPPGAPWATVYNEGTTGTGNVSGYLSDQSVDSAASGDAAWTWTTQGGTEWAARQFAFGPGVTLSGVRHIIARGIGFNPGSPKFIVTHGLAPNPAVTFDPAWAAGLDIGEPFSESVGHA